MGTWGTGIFADDTALDVRDDWRDAIMDGLEPEEATERVLERCAEILKDEDESKILWLALAAAQSETGRLVPKIRDRALGLIEIGGDLGRWAEEDPALARQRAKVLERLAQRLRGPQRPPTKMRRPRPRPPGLDIGDVLLIRNDRERAQALFVVVAYYESWPPGSLDPVLATLLWTDESLPSNAKMGQIPLLLDDDGPGPHLELKVVMNPSRGKHAFGPQFGEIVEKDVLRPDIANDLRKAGPLFGGHCGWLYLVEWVAGKDWGFGRCVELTRRVKKLST